MATILCSVKQSNVNKMIATDCIKYYFYFFKTTIACNSLFVFEGILQLLINKII